MLSRSWPKASAASDSRPLRFNRAVWPEFYDETKADAVRGSFLEGLKQNYGIDPQTVSSVLDHRFYLIAKDALAYRGVKKDAPSVSAKLKVKPKVVKPGTRTQSKPQAKQLAEARARLKRPRFALDRNGVSVGEMS